MNKLKLKMNIYKSSVTTNRAQAKVSQRIETSSFFGKFFKEFFKMFILIFMGFIILFPFYYMISTSLMTRIEVLNPTGDTPIFLPDDPQWGNYGAAFKDGYIAAFTFSSAVMISNILLKVFVCMLLGYAFGNYEFKFKKQLWSIFLVSMIIPEIALISGQYKLTMQLGMLDGIMLMVTLAGPYVASIFTAYMFRNAFESIPTSVKEAALVDGVTGTRYFTKIAMPMVSSTTWTVVILSAFASWNSYMWPALVLAPLGLETIPLWLFGIGADEIGSGQIHEGIQMAGSVMAIIPTTIFYLIFKNKINNTIASAGGNKG